MIRVWIAWLILFGLIIYEIHSAFEAYRKDKQSWKLLTHIGLLIALGIINLQMGTFCMKMRFIPVDTNSFPMTRDNPRHHNPK